MERLSCFLLTKGAAPLGSAINNIDGSCGELNTVAALAATSYSYKGLYIRRNLPQYQEVLDEFARSVPGDVRNTIEKCHRDLHFTMAGPWLLLGYWQFLAVASDWVTDPVSNMLTVAFALLYCAMNLLQFIVTTPSVTVQQGDMDSDKTVAVLSGASVGSRHEVEPGRDPGQVRERRESQTQTDEHERIMREREEIVQGLYLFNGPPPVIRGSMLERNRVEVKDRPSQSVPIAIITAIDDYGNTYQQAVLKAPVAVVRNERPSVQLLPSTSRAGEVDRLERGENRAPNNSAQGDDELDRETLEYIEQMIESIFEMAIQNQDYLERLLALRSW
ncbi:unnamed protein product [Heligmosomoides polygyrus]|uniref:Bestrophin homolog n=1 Tax=Heligmosomoides polygyrus TaxID=6339 RepID=A0A183FNM2_HELPZ|nr:unnamed protein product [Heligmosomoides polygyrus]